MTVLDLLAEMKAAHFARTHLGKQADHLAEVAVRLFQSRDPSFADVARAALLARRAAAAERGNRR